MEQTKPAPHLRSADIALAQHCGRQIDSDQALVGIKDREHRYLFANCPLESLHGISSGGLFGMPSEILVRNEHVAEEIHARENYVVQIGMAVHFIERIHLGDKLHVWQTIRFPLIERNGTETSSAPVFLPLIPEMHWL